MVSFTITCIAQSYILRYICKCMWICIYTWIWRICLNSHTTVTIVPCTTRILNIVQNYWRIFHWVALDSTNIIHNSVLLCPSSHFLATASTEYGYMYHMNPWTYASLNQIRPHFIQRLFGGIIVYVTAESIHGQCVLNMWLHIKWPVDRYIYNRNFWLVIFTNI